MHDAPFRLRLSLAILLLAATAAGLSAQDTPEKRGAREAARRGGDPPVVVTPASPDRAAPGRHQEPPEEPAGPPVIRLDQPREGARLGPGNGAQDDPRSPRPVRPLRVPPFADDRPLLEVDGIEIRAAEVNELVGYFNSFRPGSVDLLIRDALSALIPRAVVQAAYGEALPGMEARIREAQRALQGGEDFARVVAQYSDDTEAPTEDGRYVFGREEAVQPFDRLAHTSPRDTLQGPFLTQYGYHLLEVVDYERGADPKDDRTHVRHVLVMFPFQGEDPRQEIRGLLENCRIRVLDPGLRNALDPRFRANVVSAD